METVAVLVLACLKVSCCPGQSKAFQPLEPYTAQVYIIGSFMQTVGVWVTGEAVHDLPGDRVISNLQVCSFLNEGRHGKGVFFSPWTFMSLNLISSGCAGSIKLILLDSYEKQKNNNSPPHLQLLWMQINQCGGQHHWIRIQSVTCWDSERGSHIRKNTHFFYLMCAVVLLKIV